MKRKFVLDENIITHAIKETNDPRYKASGKLIQILAENCYHQIALDGKLKKELKDWIETLQKDITALQHGSLKEKIPITSRVIPVIKNLLSKQGKVIFSSEPAPRFNGEQDYPEEDIYLARIAHHHRALLVSDDLGIMMADPLCQYKMRQIYDHEIR